MKPISALLPLALFLGANSFAQESPNEPRPLKEGDRSFLLEQLDSLRDRATENATQRFTGASSAFRQAVTSDDAAVELYVQCVEQVDFKDRERSSSEFREWKKNNKQRLSDESFAVALRLQLRWLMLTLRANATPDDVADLGPEAASIIETLFRDPKALAPQVGLLTENVGGTVFARAYKIHHDRLEGWPMAPLERSGRSFTAAPVYEKVILPPLRKARKYDELRTAWATRIRQDEIAAGFWSGEGERSEEGQSLERERFLTETEPQLRWQAEADLFRTGDEKSAAVQMLKHLENHLSHPQARAWEDEFRQLISPKKEGDADGTAGN
ncbi:MAG: hypothetical protein MUF31_12470 [Akkermansiaceae bacterium]|nr:hypothetical protein [Akkermansiaceae bacterium]